MKTKLLIGFWLLLGVSTVLAQPKMAKKPMKLISSPNEIYMNANWSPNGQKIAFTAEEYNGLWVCNSNGKQIEKITSDLSAGFAYQWSSDSKNILARPVVEDNSVRFHQVVHYSIENKSKAVLIDRTLNLKSLPVWTNSGTSVAVLTDEGVKEVSSGKPALKGKVIEDSIETFGRNLIKGSSSIELSAPEFKGRYVYNLVQSPDGSKIVFQVNGLGLYVANADGSNRKHLGFGEQASWMPDGKYVVVTVVKDNGYTITSGEIEAIDVNSGKSYPILSDSGYVALNPDVSPDGKSILFDNEPDGAIYLLKLK